MPYGEGQTLDNMLGSLFIGSVLAAVLYGVTSLQSYWYYHWFYKRDSMVHRVAVGVLWTLDTFHLFLIAHGVYHYCVTGFSNPTKLNEIVWSMKLQIVINVVIILLVQGLYTYRVWLLGGYHNALLAYVVIATVAGAFGVGMVLAHQVYTLKDIADHQKIGWAIISSLATATIVDFIIAGAMVYYLQRSRGLQSRMNSKIATMMQFVLGSGFLTSACSTSALIAYVVMPKTLVFMGIESLLTKLYINSFLAMLNARERVHQEPDSRLSVRITTSLSKPNASDPPSGLSAASSDNSLANQSISFKSPVSPSPILVKEYKGISSDHPYPW
ncbi:hypothetical protein BDN71DRAFT_856638 [Pleurotus eryngii]|uniref:DUF6534 domain-containing protein n=1 Tax=Pleurotus eryngii TaxID=5323 RepID=A0A9P6DJQ8_PLEER|nr:hypothetical protein BDN71DRAFT_856638 [Pleurotus eryngii]